MNISLTPELDNFILEKVQSGMYHSASEVVREGLRLLQLQDQLRQAKLDQLRQEIQAGFDQVDRGEYKEFELADLPALAEEIKAKGRAILKVRKMGPR